jgi:hypothetical protein
MRLRDCIRGYSVSCCQSVLMKRVENCVASLADNSRS